MVYLNMNRSFSQGCSSKRFGTIHQLKDNEIEKTETHMQDM